jgi:hypothetical protein
MHWVRNKVLTGVSALLVESLQLGALLPSPALADPSPTSNPPAPVGSMSIVPL